MIQIFQIKDYIKFIDDFVLSLGDEVSKTYANNCVIYRRIKNFLYIVQMEDEILTIILKQKNKYKKYQLKNENDFNKITNAVEASYEEKLMN